MCLLFLVNRGCTDIICCILFILALLGYFAVGILGKIQPINFHISIHNATMCRWAESIKPCQCLSTIYLSYHTDSAVCFVIAWSKGDPRKVIYPTDSKGQFCGQVGTELE